MPVTVNGISCTLAGGVRETTTTTGTGTYSLIGAATVDGIIYRTFVAGVGSGVTTVYTARLGSQFETGIGTVTSGAPATLTRSSILESSNANAAVNWGAGTKDIFIDAAAAVFHSLQSTMDTTIFASVKTTVRTTTGTFTRDTKCIAARVRIVGGGGGGGGTATTGAGEGADSGGGGGGEYAEGYFTSAQIGASQTVTIGAGGTAGVPNGIGGTGGTTSFGALLTAIGGGGGGIGVDAAGNATADAGIGGSGGTGGYLRVRGGEGGRGRVIGGEATVSNRGGASLLGGSKAASTSTPSTGQLYGGGGTGSAIGQNTSGIAGGTGAAGVCIIEEFLSR